MYQIMNIQNVKNKFKYIRNYRWIPSYWSSITKRDLEHFDKTVLFLRVSLIFERRSTSMKLKKKQLTLSSWFDGWIDLQ